MPPVCELYPGICLTTEEKARKNLNHGSRRMPVGTMKTEYTEWYRQVNAEVFGNKTDPVPLCPLQTPHILTRYRIGTSVVTDSLLVTTPIVRPYLGVFRLPSLCGSGLQSSGMLPGKYWKSVTQLFFFWGGGISVPISCRIVKE